ncbi:VCBS repeat-containing protein [Arcicella rigui]|uniref:VCBS repeat-containing protein n=1 Tax=Arcicella rigui TaxID=797020 RepID=A0ABU5Q6Z9_9BACT|nr:VCBS repeat-containing protein [Arcicella rigui]MEA5138372.1 VCBS repeat-containing protein [Arcicella rigui]
MLFISVFTACKRSDTLFKELSSSETGITFVNQVEENDKYNVLEYMNIYTGAGVAAGDVNNDGFTDLYFSGNQVSGKLYLNKGNQAEGISFLDITEEAGIKTDRWCTGVSMVDINQDGWLDIYINVSGSAKFGKMANLLYINNGPSAKDKNLVTFTESAEAYGIAEKRQTMNASFFDYDVDGDLDLFLITNPADEMITGVNTVKDRLVKGESEGTDILYRNNGNHTFTDVSKEAGILMDGYSLGAAISDINQDGFPDIYVSNDFLTNDILYINNGDGTFTDKITEYLKHTSFASMGNDIADINNDGLTDIFVLDMLPEDNYRKKMLIPATGYDKFQLTLKKGYSAQYTRNTLQLNNGVVRTPKGNKVSFSEIAFLAGISSTDWSWSSLFADYDNDGDKDLMVTNGFYRDLGDLDYINYQFKSASPMGSEAVKRAEKLKAIHSLVKVPLNNYLYENNGDLTFSNRIEDWGFDSPSFSNGACYADLDNDGDLELVINEFNAEAKVYENRANELRQHHFITLKMKGASPNIQGIGTKVWLYADGKTQFQELNPYRGYESTVESTLHFGIGKSTAIDSLVVMWPNQQRQVILHPKINQILQVKYAPNSQLRTIDDNKNWLFQAVESSRFGNFVHQENDFVDFKQNPLLPHQHSQNGPCIAVGDVNGDGLEDFYVGGSSGFSGVFFWQNASGTFSQHPLNQHLQEEDTGALLFDADNDKDLDLYVVSGGTEFGIDTELYQDRLYFNDGKGNFTFQPKALPNTKSSGSCVQANDYDHDGDLDIFVGGRISVQNYPMPATNYLLRNDKGVFTDVTPPVLAKIGMVSSALWQDYDADGWDDLVIVGEFMPITFLKNLKGNFSVREKIEIPNSNGWWNVIASGDFDHDGDSDFVAGNLGLNTRYKANVDEPLQIHAKDFDKNGTLDPIMSYYIQGKNYISHTRDELAIQIPSMKLRFDSYKKYAETTFENSFMKQELEDAFVLKSTHFASSYIENVGNGNFKIHTLPIEAQFAPVCGLVINDFNHDKHLDILLAGNSYSTESSTGRYDALTGLLLVGNGKGNFGVKKSVKTGFLTDKNAKSLVKVRDKDQNFIVVGNNSDQLQIFKYK